MSTISRKLSDFFGLTPAHDDAGYPDPDYRGGYRDEPRGRGTRADDGYVDDYDDYGRTYPGDDIDQPHLRPLDRPVAPALVRITPKADFLDQYSEAREIGMSFRDGDIVIFDLVDLEPTERKRYLDFVAGLAFALRGRIEADGTRFTLLPEGAELSGAERDRMSV